MSLDIQQLTEASKQKNGLRWSLHQKRWFGKWHLYLGIIAGAILCVVGLTGSVLVFEDEIDIALNKKLFESLQGQKRYTIAEIVPVVQLKYPDKKFDYVYQWSEDNPNATYRFYNFATEEDFFINPYTGELSGSRLAHSGFTGIVTDIHRTLLVPVAGRYMVGLATLCMLVLTISGLRLWVPQQYRKWKQWKAVLTVNFKAGFKRQNYDWHNVLGFYSAPVVILISLSGFAITFSNVFIAFLFMLTGNSPQSVAGIFDQRSAYTQGAKSLSTIEVAQIGAASFPGGTLLGIAMPADKNAVYRLDIKSKGASKTGNRVMMMVDQYTGRVAINSEKDFPNIGNSYLTWLTPIHFGSFGGMPTRILACIGGLIPLALYITGFIIWWPRYKKQSDKAVIAPRLGTKDREPENIRNLPTAIYFNYYFRKGMKYGGMLLLSSFIAGALYGLISGIVLQPGLFGVVYTGISIFVNFLVALLVILFNLLFLVPSRRSVKSTYKYFSLSLALVIVFLPVTVAIAVWCKDVF